jgi:ribosomal protein L4
MKLKVAQGGSESRSPTQLRREVQRSPRPPGRHGLSQRRSRRHQGARRPAPRSAAAARSRGARRARVRPAPARSAARSGSAAVARSPQAAQTSSRRSTARCTAARMRSMLGELVRQDRLVVTTLTLVDAPKTKLLLQQLKELELVSALIVVEAIDEKLLLAARNLPHVDVLTVAALNPLALVRVRQGPDDGRCREDDRGAPAMTAAAASGTMERLITVLLAPHITEKTSLAMQNANQYAFRVRRDANKTEVAGRRADVRRQGRRRPGRQRARQGAPLRQDASAARRTGRRPTCALAPGQDRLRGPVGRRSNLGKR